MSGQLPSPAPSDRKALAEALSLEDLRAAFAEEKIENAKLESKITELEAKMELLEKQVRDLEAEPWGKKKVRQLKERKRAREEAKAQRAMARGDEPPAKRTARRGGSGGHRRDSVQPADTAAVDADVTAEAPKVSPETSAPVKIPGLDNYAAEKNDEVPKEKAVSEESIEKSIQIAPEAEGSETIEDVDMIEDEVDGGSLFSDDEFDFFAQEPEEHNSKSDDGDIVPSVEPCSSPTASPTFENKVTQEGGLRAKWKSGMLELERLQESERGVRSGNPSPLSAPNSAVPRLNKPFQAFVTNEAALDASKDHVMSLRGGAGEPAGSSKKRKRVYKSKAEAAIKAAMQELIALRNPETLQLPFPPMHIQIDELVMEPYTSMFNEPIDRSRKSKKKKETHKGSDKLKEAKVTILGDNQTQDTEPNSDNPLPSPPGSPTVPELPKSPELPPSPGGLFNTGAVDPDAFTFAQPSPLGTTFKASASSKANKLPWETSTSDIFNLNKDGEAATNAQSQVYTLAESGIPEGSLTLAKALEDRRRMRAQAQSERQPSAPKDSSTTSPETKQAFLPKPRENNKKAEALRENRVTKRRWSGTPPRRSGRLSRLSSAPVDSPTQWSFKKFLDQEVAQFKESTAKDKKAAAADGQKTPVEQLPEEGSPTYTFPDFLDPEERAAPLGDPLDKDALGHVFKESEQVLEETKDSTASGKRKRSWDLLGWTSLFPTNKSSPLDTQPPTPPPWELTHRPPTPGIPFQRHGHRAKPRSILLIDENEQEAAQTKGEAAPSTPQPKKPKAASFSILPTSAKKKVHFDLPDVPGANAKLQTPGVYFFT